MPRISKFHYKDFWSYFSYDVKMKKFCITLTGELSGYADDYKHRIFGESEALLKNEFKRVVDLYIEKGSKREKVIAIQVDSGRSGCFYSSDFTRAGGSSGAFQIQFAVIDKVVFGDSAKYYDKHGGRFHAAEMEDTVIIPWTGERETALSKIIEDTDDLGKRIASMVSASNFVRRLDCHSIKLLQHKG